MWAMVHFRELPEAIGEIDENILEIIFNFANTFTEESVLQGYIKHIKETESGPSADIMKDLGYSDEDVAGMDL
jgi:hypothetical protein